MTATESKHNAPISLDEVNVIAIPSGNGDPNIWRVVLSRGDVHHDGRINPADNRQRFEYLTGFATKLDAHIADVIPLGDKIVSTVNSRIEADLAADAHQHGEPFTVNEDADIPPEFWEDPPEQQPKTKEPLKFKRITCAELDGTDYALSYLVEDVLVDQQPCLIAGPLKSLKTCVLVDLSISLAVAERFLGVFKVPKPVRVGIMSGESGLATLQDTARRIARAAGHELAAVENLIWSPDLPVFGHLEHMDALEKFIRQDELQVIAIDPAYLCTPLAADKGNNLFAIGELLRRDWSI